MKKVLFISHDASRTGAPMIVLFLLQWFKKHHKDILIDTLLVEGGSMEEEFIKASNKVFNYKALVSAKKLSNKLIDKLLKKIETISPRKLFINELILENYDVIYANSVVSIPLAVIIKKNQPKSKLLLHVHELNNVIKARVPDFKSYIQSVDHFIAPSNIVKENLIFNYKVLDNKISIVREFSKLKETTKEIEKTDKFVIGGCGTISLRKGFDAFIQVAIQIKKKYPKSNIEFVWIGGNAELIDVAKSDIQKAGLKDSVYFVGEQTDLMSYFKYFDVFLLPSREDPFPLVCIDLALLSTPIICFEGATGIAEILVEGGGHIVPYLDVEEMTLKVIDYYNHPESLVKDGKKAKELFSDFTPEKICPIIYQRMESLIQ